MNRYLVREIFYSLQGEGARAGTPNVFVRFAKCNLSCDFCDTDFATGDWYTIPELLAEMRRVADPECDWVIFTGGEPMLQLDADLVRAARADGWHLAIETNGMFHIPFALDWICVSPKNDDLAQLWADEVKFVTFPGAPLPTTPIKAEHYLLSPVSVLEPCDHDGDCEPPACPGPWWRIDSAALQHCITLCLDNPPWRLSCQQHKWWGVR